MYVIGVTGRNVMGETRKSWNELARCSRYRNDDETWLKAYRYCPQKQSQERSVNGDECRQMVKRQWV